MLNQEKCLLGQKVSHREEVATAMEKKAYLRSSGTTARTVQGKMEKKTKQSGVSKTRLTFPSKNTEFSK